MPGPNFYKIDCDREVVLQGQSSFYITVSRNDAAGGISISDDLYVCAYVQPHTFETTYTGLGITFPSPGVTGQVAPGTFSSTPGFNRVEVGSVIKDYAVLGLTQAPTIVAVDYTATQPTVVFDAPIAAGPYTVDLGRYVQDGENWKVNGAEVDLLGTYVETALSTPAFAATIPNPFDGTTAPTGSGYISRSTVQQWIRIPFDSNNLSTNGATFRIDYSGAQDGHLKLNLLCFRGSSVTLAGAAALVLPDNNMPYGLKSGDGSGNYNPNADYQEIHLFGYTESPIRTSRENTAVPYPVQTPLYEDRVSYGLLKTNPKLSGNVKITTDSSGDIWLNSFSASDELADSRFKRYAISSNSTYQKDLWNFFRKGIVPSSVVFQLYEEDNQYLNNKSSYAKQYDTFYNYGVEQLRSKFYPENFSFLAPLWLKKTVPDFFVIFRVDHPVDVDSYTGASHADSFSSYFEDAQIIKTFDLRGSSKLGSYIRKITEDPRFKEKPLDVSWENDVATYWNGISYQTGSIASKAEFLYDYYRQDRPIKEFEEYITGGFERNGIICANLLNLEFLFDDDEAPLYGINRYTGFYVTETQLAEFEIEPRALAKIPAQDPLPKPGVDGEPYSTRTFIQKNPGGIELPVSYYHSEPFTNNTSNVPAYSGTTVGKFPLPSMVADPLRIFYVKDRDDIFKRIIRLTENEYGYPGTLDYLRVTQLSLFDKEEDISKYGGVNQIVSQFVAESLQSGSSQLVLQLDDLHGTGVFEDDEEIVLQVEKYNDFPRVHEYAAQVIATDNTTFATLAYFIDKFVARVTAGFIQPVVGVTVTVNMDSTAGFAVGQTLYLTHTSATIHGNYEVVSIPTTTSLVLRNLGGFSSIPPLTVVPANGLLAEGLSGTATYNFNALSTAVGIDNYLTLQLLGFSTYAVMDGWKISVNYPSLSKATFIPGSGNIDAQYAPSYPQFTWKMIANSTGLRPTESWDFPAFDAQSECYISHFSNEGTPAQVAEALASCINSMEGLPVVAVHNESIIYATSSLGPDESASVLLQRFLRPASTYGNLGFYEKALCNPLASLSIQPYSPNVDDYGLRLLEAVDSPTVNSYYINLYRPSLGTLVITGQLLVNPATYATATTSGTFFNSGVLNISTGAVVIPQLPFSIDVDLIPIATSINQVVTLQSTSTIEQYFVGQSNKDRNRIKVAAGNGQQYYESRETQVLSTTQSGSTTIIAQTSGLYLGAQVTGAGIPVGATITSIKSTFFIISEAATATAITTLRIGGIFAGNREKITQVWYQTLKGMYRKIKGWEVQGQYIYSLPFLDDPIIDEVTEKVVGYEDSQDLVLQVEDPTQEFYLSDDQRAIAYSLYRPKFGIFSIFPLREFDFDFYLSDYSYTPTIEAFRYFFDEKVENGAVLELPLYENYELRQYDVNGGFQTAYPYNIELEVYDELTASWTLVDTINATAGPVLTASSPENLLINTFFPLYDYDANEKPLAPMLASAGKRNFDRRTIRVVGVDGQSREIFPSRVRIRYNNQTIGDYLQVVNYNYSADQDVQTFNGFAGLQDITTIGDDDVIQGLKDQGKQIDAYTYQLLLSEYDRLRENYTKDWAVKSIVVPYISKWVQEGTDARDNYYRLNNSAAFGLGNLSPLDNIDFAESSVLTHEWPYLDSTPKNFPAENLAGSRSYMFSRLSDEAAKGSTWYELLKNDNTEDWFTKYFTAGSPTDLGYDGAEIYRPREERYTFFGFNESQGRSFTLFRGGKLEAVLFDETGASPIEKPGAPDLEGYKFAAIASFEPYSPFIKQSPIEFEIVRNEKYKWIATFITIRIQDYRSQDGSLEYAFQYFMRDLLSNSNQQQVQMSLPITPIFPASPLQPYSVELANFLPYEIGYTPGYTDDSVMRPRQGIVGGGYLRLSHKRLSSIASLTPIYSLATATLSFQPVVAGAQVNLVEEIVPIQSLYPVDYTATSPFIYNNTALPIVPQTYGVNGFFFNFHTACTASNTTTFKYIPSNQTTSVGLGSATVSIGSAANTNIFSTKVPFTSFQHGLNSTPSLPIIALPIGGVQPVETTLLEGGTVGFEQIQNFLTFGNISSLLNSADPVVKYYRVTDAGAATSAGLALRVVSPDALIKGGVLQYLVDEEKPDEFANVETIGYVTGNTNSQEYLLRHRGPHEPKTRDVVTSWLREDAEFSTHYSRDFLLGNTHIDSKSARAGMLRNYGFNKVSTAGNILSITRSAAFQSLYPLVKEVAVDHADVFSLASSWDAGFYRDYTTGGNYTEIEGIAEMQESKNFLASKVMNVPKSFEVHTFTPSEVTFELIQPALGIGVDNLVTNATSRNASTQNSNKPKLVIQLDLRSRLLRELVEDITTQVATDEFERLQTLSPPALANLTSQEVSDLRTSYFEKNIINLYEVTEVVLYAKSAQGIQLLRLDLTEAAKSADGYRVTADCVVTQVSDFVYRIEKTLEANTSVGFSIAASYKRI